MACDINNEVSDPGYKLGKKQAGDFLGALATGFLMKDETGN